MNLTWATYGIRGPYNLGDEAACILESEKASQSRFEKSRADLDGKTSAYLPRVTS